MSALRLIDFALTAAFFVLGILAILGVQKFPFADQLFPITAAVAMIVCAIAYAIRQVVVPIPFDDETGDGDSGNPFTRRGFTSIIGPAASVLLLIVGVLFFGHLVTVPLFVAGYILWKREPVWIAALCGGLIFLFIWGVLIQIMHSRLPEPYLSDLLPFLPY